MQSEEKPRLMDCKETSRYLGITEAALRKRIFLRQIKGLVRLGGSIYFDRKKLERFLEEAEIKNGKEDSK